MFNNYLVNQYKSNHKILEANTRQGSVFLGDLNSALDLSFIQANNIKTVITAAQSLDQVKYQNQINHIIYPLLDTKSEKISEFFQENFRNIQENRSRGNILIHCAAGVSRSATLLISYVMKKNQWPFKTAINFVRQKRPMICPNLGFEMQLKQYQKSLFVKTRNSSRETKTSEHSKHKLFQKPNLPEILNIYDPVPNQKQFKRKQFSIKPFSIRHILNEKQRNLDLLNNLKIQCLNPERKKTADKMISYKSQDKKTLLTKQKQKDQYQLQQKDLKRITIIKLGLQQRNSISERHNYEGFILKPLKKNIRSIK